MSRRRKIVLAIVLSLAAVAALPLVLVSIPAVRERALGEVLVRVERQLEGDLDVGDVRWSRLGWIRVRDLAWIAKGDTLAAVGSLDVEVAIRPLFAGQVIVEHVRLEGVRADVPGVLANAPQAVPPAEPEAPAAPPAPAWPPDLEALLPPLAIRELSIAGGDIRIDETNTIRSFTIAASVDAVSAGHASLAVDTLRVVDGAGEWALDSFTLTGDLGQGSFTGRLHARYRQLAVRWAFEARLAERLSVATAPLTLTAGDGGGSEPAGRVDGEIRFDPRDGTLEIRGFEIAGDLGEYRIDATRQADGSIAADLGCVWERSPVPGIRAVAPESIPEGGEAALESIGTAGTSATLHAEVRPAAGAEPLHAHASGSFVLPGPRHLAALLPPDLEVGDLGVVRGELELDARVAELPREPGASSSPGLDVASLVFDANVDLSATEWLDELRLRASGRGAEITVDTLHVELPGLLLSTHATFDSTRVEASVLLETPDQRLLRRLGPATADVEATLRAEASASGPIANPRLDLRAEGRVVTPAATIPKYELTLEERAGGRHLALRTPEGLVTGTTAWERLDVDLRFPADTLAPFPLHAEIDAGGEALDIGVTADVRGSESKRIDAAFSRLAVRVQEYSLSSENPFGLRVDPDAGRIEIEDLALAGDLGMLRVNGGIGEDVLALEMDVSLSLPPDVLREMLPEAARPREKDVALTVEAHATASGTSASPTGSARARASLAAEGETALGLAVEGVLEAAGVRAELEITYGDTKLGTGQLSLPGHLSQDPPGWIMPPGDSMRAALRAPGIDLEVFDPLLPEGARVKGNLRANLDAAGTVPLSLTGDLKLSDFEARWDERSWLAAKAEATVAGTTEMPRVVGSLETTSGVVYLPPPPPKLHPTDGAALLWDERIPASPVLADSPTTTDPAGAPGDTASATAATSARNGTPVAPEGGAVAADSLAAPVAPLPQLDLDFQVLIPGQVRLRGPGLEMELAGDVRVRSLPDAPPGTPPTASGVIEVREGTYQFLGREFVLERGQATLYGERVPDPALDVVLRTEVPDAVVRIVVSGTASTPRVAMRSEPEMSEGEILSLLVSGGGGEGDFDAGALLAGLGLSQLQARAAAKAGLDTIEYRQGDGESASSSLVVGKYLSPKLVLKYEQSLDDTSAFLAKLNYVLNRHFKLETTYSAGGESGLELFWSRED